MVADFKQALADIRHEAGTPTFFDAFVLKHGMTIWRTDFELAMDEFEKEVASYGYE